MNLDQAIKKIINDHGADILKERRVVSMLSDLQAFGQLPYAANMLRHIYDNGYGTKIHQLYCSQDQTEVAAFLSELRNKLGFDENMLKKILYAFSLPVAKTSTKKKNTNQQKNTNQRKQTNTQQNNASQQHYNQQYNNYNQQSSNYQQPTYQQPTFQQQSYNFGNGASSNQRVESYWNPSSYNTNQSYNNPISKPSQKTSNVNKVRAWKIIATIVAIVLNIPTYFVSNKWLFLTIILTIVTTFMLYRNSNKRIWILYTLLITFFITVFTTIFTSVPSWIFLLEMIGYFTIVGFYRDSSSTQIWALKVIASIIVIGLNIPICYVSGWWLILTGILTLFTVSFFGEDKGSLYDDSPIKAWFLFALFIAIFISIWTPIAWWILLIEVIAYIIVWLIDPYSF